MSIESNVAAAEPAPMRRGLLLAAAGVAVVGGVGLGWWQGRQADGADGNVDVLLWSQSFDTLAGPKLALASFKGRPLLINFWATWCAPCVEELPLLDRFAKENASKGWNVVGLAIDQPSAVQRFLQKLPVSFSIGLAGLGGTDLIKVLGNSSGGLPFSIVLGTDGKVLHRKMGQVTPADLDAWMRQT